MIKLFTCGPVQIYPSTAIIREKGFIHFRTKEYGDIVKSTLKDLSFLLGNNSDFATVYLACSGTGAMEAVVENCISRNDKALVINGGAFGKRFCELLKYHNIPFESINLAWDEVLTKDHFSIYDNKDFTHLFVNIHETYTGQLYDIKLISNFCKRNNLYLVVDAISSFLADEYSMEKYGIDVTIISSQKGLCCSPGCSIVSFSERMIDKIYNSNNIISFKYFDFKDYLDNINRGQTPYTPPVLVMYEIQDMLNIIDQEGGLNSRLNIVKDKGKYFRSKALEMGLKIPNYPISNMLTPIYFENINAYNIIQVLKDKYQIYVNPCGGDLADKLLRVSHIGNTNLDDIDYLIKCLKSAIYIIKEEEKGKYNENKDI